MLKKALACLIVAAACQTGTAQAQELPPQCSRLVKHTKNLIWKGCAASGHLSKDPRGRGVALIAKKGTSLRVDKCMRIYKLDGTEIGAMYLYPFNDPRAYAWRGYSNYVRGCGAGATMKRIRNRSNNENIFIKIRKSNGGACLKINKAWSNKNSSQSCPR